MILIGSMAGIAIYAWLLYAFAIIVLQATAFLAVAAVLAILAWIGWTMATTPPPGPLDLESAATSAPDNAAKPAGEIGQHKTE